MNIYRNNRTSIIFFLCHCSLSFWVVSLLCWSVSICMKSTIELHKGATIIHYTKIRQIWLGSVVVNCCWADLCCSLSHPLYQLEKHGWMTSSLFRNDDFSQLSSANCEFLPLCQLLLLKQSFTLLKQDWLLPSPLIAVTQENDILLLIYNIHFSHCFIL